MSVMFHALFQLAIRITGELNITGQAVIMALPSVNVNI